MFDPRARFDNELDGHEARSARYEYYIQRCFVPGWLRKGIGMVWKRGRVTEIKPICYLNETSETTTDSQVGSTVDATSPPARP